jgi:hypothetical protein
MAKTALITGNPHAFASNAAIPKPSLVEGMTKTFDDFIMETTSA